MSQPSPFHRHTELFNGSEPTLIVDSRQAWTRLVSQGREVILLEVLDTLPDAAFFLCLTWAGARRFQRLRPMLPRSRIVVIPQVSFSAHASVASYTFDALSRSDLSGAVARQRGWVDALSRAGDTVNFASADAEIVCHLSPAVSLCAMEEPVVKPGTAPSVAEFCELTFGVRHPSDPFEFVIDGTL